LEEKKLQAIKEEVEEKLRNESKDSVKKAISEANKSLNIEENELLDDDDDSEYVDTLSRQDGFGEGHKLNIGDSFNL